MSAIELFSGAGGMCEGLLQAGFSVIFSSDINKEAALTHVKRLGQLGYVHGKDTCYHLGDIRQLTGVEVFSGINSLNHEVKFGKEDIDTLFGGPPCQGFSRAGLRRHDDPRNMLFREHLRIIDETRPKYIVTENVEGFLNFKLNGYISLNKKAYPDGTPLVEILHEEFHELGYETLEPQTLDAACYGVPQHRKRVIFMAYVRGCKKPSIPEPSIKCQYGYISTGDAISDLSGFGSLRDQSPYQSSSIAGRTPNIMGKPVRAESIVNHETSRHSGIVTERFKLYKDGENTRNLIARLQNTGIQVDSVPLLFKEYKTKINAPLVINGGGWTRDKGFIDFIVSKKRSRQKFDMNRPAPTIMTLQDDYIIPGLDRTPSVREMARLQSFDDSFIFHGSRTTGGHRRRVDVPQYSQVGNAVPPLLAKALAIEIAKCL